jgi:hypothetical protein
LAIGALPLARKFFSKIMEISFAVFFSGVALCLMAFLFFSKKVFDGVNDWLLFSKSAPLATFGVGGLWFLCNLWHMSVADFGEYRLTLCLLFGAVILLSFAAMRELLAVRGLAVLSLLWANFAMNEVCSEASYVGGAFVVFLYATIPIAMIAGSLPYLVRDFLQFAASAGMVRLAVATLFAVLGVCILCLSFGRPAMA